MTPPAAKSVPGTDGSMIKMQSEPIKPIDRPKRDDHHHEGVRVDKGMGRMSHLISFNSSLVRHNRNNLVRRGLCVCCLYSAGR